MIVLGKLVSLAGGLCPQGAKVGAPRRLLGAEQCTYFPRWACILAPLRLSLSGQCDGVFVILRGAVGCTGGLSSPTVDSVLDVTRSCTRWGGNTYLTGHRQAVIRPNRTSSILGDDLNERSGEVRGAGRTQEGLPCWANNCGSVVRHCAATCCACHIWPQAYCITQVRFNVVLYDVMWLKVKLECCCCCWWSVVRLPSIH